MPHHRQSTLVFVNRILCSYLVIHNMILTAYSLFSPRKVLKFFQPQVEPEPQTLWLLRREAAGWLLFILIQLWATIRADDPRALRAAALLRLQAVGPDAMWLVMGEGFGKVGKISLASASLFNLAAGTYLWKAARALEDVYEPGSASQQEEP